MTLTVIQKHIWTIYEPFRRESVLDVKGDVGRVCAVDETLLLVVCVEDFFVAGACAKARRAGAGVTVRDKQ